MIGRSPLRDIAFSSYSIFISYAHCSTFDQIDRQAAAGGFLILGLHIGAGVAHGFDHLVQRNEMLTVAAQGDTGGIDGFDRAHRIALDARHLHKPSDRIAS